MNRLDWVVVHVQNLRTSMNLGFATENAKGTAELDPVAEFTKGVEFLKNKYP
jgi:hypothetical protein